MFWQRTKDCGRHLNLAQVDTHTHTKQPLHNYKTACAMRLFSDAGAPPIYFDVCRLGSLFYALHHSYYTQKRTISILEMRMMIINDLVREPKGLRREHSASHMFVLVYYIICLWVVPNINHKLNWTYLCVCVCA